MTRGTATTQARMAPESRGQAQGVGIDIESLMIAIAIVRIDIGSCGNYLSCRRVKERAEAIL